MSRDENPPFGRGETFYNGATIDTNNLGGGQHLGKIWEWEDLDYSAGTVGARKARTGRTVKTMAVRNVGAVALLAKQLVTFKTSGGSPIAFSAQVDGECTTDAQEAFPIDEFLPSAGLLVNDIGWIVIEGPAMCLTPLDGGADNVFNVGTVVTALTAASSGATSAGRVKPQVLTGATSPLALEVMNMVGRALSAATTSNTNANLLVDVRKW